MSFPDEYRLALELQEKESDRYWSRSNVLLLVHGALISFYISVARNNSWYTLAVAVEGVFLGIIWLGILFKGKRYVSRWGYAAAEVERITKAKDPSLANRNHPILEYYEAAKRAEPASRLFIYRRNTTTLMRYAVYSIITFWCIAIVVFIIVRL